MNAKEMVEYLRGCDVVAGADMLEKYDALARALAKEIKDNPSFYLPAKLEHLLMKAQGEVK